MYYFIDFCVAHTGLIILLHIQQGFQSLRSLHPCLSYDAALRLTYIIYYTKFTFFCLMFKSFRVVLSPDESVLPSLTL